MQATFGFALTRPASRAIVSSVGHRRGAWPASDGGVATVSQWVGRKVVPSLIALHVVIVPGGQRVDLDDAARQVFVGDPNVRAPTNRSVEGR